MDRLDTCKVFLICSGLGRINRGFESFTQECFHALSQAHPLDVTLFKGGEGSTRKEISLWNLPREKRIARFLGRHTNRGPYFVEQASFFLSLLPHIYRKRPDVIYFSDANLGNILWHWRQLAKQNYKLLFSNGGPFSPPFERWDHVQQVVPAYYRIAMDAGLSTEKQSLVPYGIKIPSELQQLSRHERTGLRRRLRLPEEDQILLSVAAINKSHKRMDYLIREIANLPDPRPYLLLLGQQEAESPEVINLGKKLLGDAKFQVRTVARDEVADYYKVADAFALTSLGEGFGRVFVEAMSYGLPCLAHDYEVSKYILEDHGYYSNFELEGSLAGLVRCVLTAEENSEAKRDLRYRHVLERFSWDKLSSSYVEMVQRCATA